MTACDFKLEIKGLSKRYDDVLALAPSDLRVKEGEFLTLLGPSGSGKTTLLMMIAGLLRPSQGSVFIDDKDATRLPAGKRGIGMVFQSYALFPHMMVSENVAYPLRMRGWKTAKMGPAVEAALRMVKMEDFAHRFPHELSGGQKQRIALARCFVYNPSIILLDEPLGALDKRLREHMQLEIRRLHKEIGATFIYVTHDQEEALLLSDRICLINNAYVEQTGTPQEIYYRPASLFAAEFIGHSNILPVEREGGPAEYACDGFRLPVPPWKAELPDSFNLLIRPECARLSDPQKGLLAGIVDELIFIGTDLRVVVGLGSNRQFVVRCVRSQAPLVGDRVGITWDVANSTPLMR
ncbi:MAG: ABC transporter ATP-binding protein [Desulfarculaceae bacterium]